MSQVDRNKLKMPQNIWGIPLSLSRISLLNGWQNIHWITSLVDTKVDTAYQLLPNQTATRIL